MRVVVCYHRDREAYDEGYLANRISRFRVDLEPDRLAVDETTRLIKAARRSGVECAEALLRAAHAPSGQLVQFAMLNVSDYPARFTRPIMNILRRGLGTEKDTTLYIYKYTRYFRDRVRLTGDETVGELKMTEEERMYYELDYQLTYDKYDPDSDDEVVLLVFAAEPRYGRMLGVGEAAPPPPQPPPPTLRAHWRKEISDAISASMEKPLPSDAGWNPSVGSTRHAAVIALQWWSLLLGAGLLLRPYDFLSTLVLVLGLFSSLLLLGSGRVIVLLISTLFSASFALVWAYGSSLAIIVNAIFLVANAWALISVVGESRTSSGGAHCVVA